MSFLTRIDEQIEDQYHELSGQASGEALKVLLESWHSAKFAAGDAKSMIDDIVFERFRKNINNSVFD